MTDFYDLKAGRLNIKYLVIGLLILCGVGDATAQINLSVKGKDFWFTIMPNFVSSPPGDSVLLTISAEQNTSGIIENSYFGYSIPFSVTAFSVTEIHIPNNKSVTLEPQIIDSTSIHIIAEDSITAFVASMQDYSRDATNLIPTQALGKEYMVSSYAASGIGSSQFVIVATEDDTEIEITPTVNTTAGNLAGVPFEVTLNRGQTYLVQANAGGFDLTGTLVSSIDSGTACSNFAVFGGSTCTNVPDGCFACDQIFTIQSPIAAWGKEYLIAPFAIDSLSAYRITALRDNTPVFIDGTQVATLNSGEFHQVFNDSGARCIASDSLIAVTQFMQGISCSSIGDPAMLWANAVTQGVYNAIFTTIDVASEEDTNIATLITAHAGIDNVIFNGNPVDSAQFIQFPGCSDYYYTYLPLSIGAHVVQSSELFTLYVYGMTYADSYAYSAGAVIPIKGEIVEIACSSGRATFTGDSTLAGSWWHLLESPDDTLSTALVLNLVSPIVPGIYVYSGFSPVSGCREDIFFRVDEPKSGLGLYAQVSDDAVCAGEEVQLSFMQRRQAFAADFNDPQVIAQFAQFDNAEITNACGALDNTALTFNGDFERRVSTPDLDAGIGGFIEFWAAVAQEGCDQPDNADVIVVEYSTNGGANWLSIDTLFPADYEDFKRFRSIIPAGAQTATTRFRIRQAGGYVSGQDIWVFEELGLFLNVSTLSDSLRWTPYSLVSDSLVVNPVGYPVGDSTYFTVFLRDSIGCVFVDSVLVVVPDTLPEPLGFDTALCEGASFEFTAAGGDVYKWWPEEGISDPAAQTVTITWTEPVIYEVLIKEIHGCDSVVQEVRIGPRSVPYVEDFHDTNLCDNNVVTFTVSEPGADIMWSDSTTGPLLVVAVAGTYWYVASNECGLSTDTIRVLTSPTPFVDLGPDTRLCPGQRELIELPQNGNTYVWGDGSGELARSITVPGTYSVIVINELGCVFRDSILFYDDCETSITYPNVFTPNGDGLNDAFYMELEYASNIAVVVYNRWGLRLFEGNSPIVQWNGTDKKGNAVPGGVYYVFISYTDREGKAMEHKGAVTLIR